MSINGLKTEIEYIDEQIEKGHIAIGKIELLINEQVERKGEVAGKLLQAQAKEKINENN